MRTCLSKLSQLALSYPIILLIFSRISMKTSLFSVALAYFDTTYKRIIFGTAKSDGSFNFDVQCSTKSIKMVLFFYARIGSLSSSSINPSSSKFYFSSSIGLISFSFPAKLKLFYWFCLNYISLISRAILSIASSSISPILNWLYIAERLFYAPKFDSGAGGGLLIMLTSLTFYSPST